jgi:hypothetical protein
MGKRDPKPSFVNVAYPNKDHGKIEKGNVGE